MSKEMLLGKAFENHKVYDKKKIKFVYSSQNVLQIAQC